MKGTLPPRLPEPDFVGGSIWGARRDALIYFPASLVPPLVGAISTAVFTRIFAASDWGLYSLAVSIVGMAAAILSGWHEKATVRFVSAKLGPPREGVDEKQTLLHNGEVVSSAKLAVRLTGWNVGAFVVPGLAAVALIGLIRPGGFAIAAAGLLFGAACIAYDGLGAVQKALLRVWSLTRARLVASVGSFAVSLGAVETLGPHVSLLVLGPAVATLAATVILALDVHEAIENPSGAPDIHVSGGPEKTSRPRLRFSLYFPRGAKAYVLYGAPLAGFYVLGSILNLSDRFLIYGLRGAAEVGIYSPNYAVGSLIVSLVAVPMSSASTARILRLSDLESSQVIRKTVASMSRDFLLAAVPVALWVTLAAKDISTVLLGEEFRSGSVVIPLVAIGTLAWALGMYVHKGLEIRARSFTMLALASVCCAVNILLNLIFIPKYGNVAAAWSTLAAYALYPVLAYLSTLRVLRWTCPWRTTACLAVSTGACALAVKIGVADLPLSHGILRAALIGVAIVGITGGVLLVTKEISLGFLKDFMGHPRVSAPRKGQSRPR